MDIPQNDPKKAKAFFDKGKTVGDTGQFDFAITMYLEGLNWDPDSKEAHEALREISLKRKASGGKNLGMIDRMKIRAGKDDKQNMLNAEKLMAYDPGNTDHMVALLQGAHKSGFYDTVMWIGPILMRANSDGKSPDANKYLALKDVYKDIKQWKLAVEACQAAMRYKPDDMNLQGELKNLGAMQTMDGGGYGGGGNFQSSLRNKDAQIESLSQQKDVVSEDVLTKAVLDAEADYKANPSDSSRINKLIEALERTEDCEHENRAIEVLEDAFKRTKLFNYRHRLGQIKMNQLRRMERSMKAHAESDPKDEGLKRDLEHVRSDRLDFELHEYSLWAEKYPTEMKYKYEAAQRLVALKRYDEAIPLYQHARTDPKLKVDASVQLGCAFLEAGFVDEAIETLQAVIDEYQIKGDDRSMLMYYWQGRSYEGKGNNEMAIKRYSQVAQWEFTYRDVQVRIKKLRNPGGGGKAQ